MRLGWLLALLLAYLQSGCLSLASAATPASPQTLPELQRQLTAAPTLRAHFVQLKRVTGLAQPLRSSGELLFSRTHGLWWHQIEPFELTLTLDERRLVQQLAGQAPEAIRADTNPQLFEFSHLLLSLFSADQQAMEQHFTLAFTPAAESWQLQLTPKQPPLNQVFERLEMQGSQELQQLLIRDRQGDETQLNFSAIQHQPEELTDVEQRRFAD